MQIHEQDQPAAGPHLTPRAQETGAGTEPAAGPAMLTPATLLHLQRAAGNDSVNSLLAGEEGEEAAEPRSPVHDVIESGGGSPLEPGTRSFMEERLGADFSDVRVHTGGRADESARSISAQAYTVGSDVVFRSGTYQPGTLEGQRILGTEAPGGIRISDPSDAFEQAAERSADAVTAGGVAQAGDSAPAATAQRVADDEEEPEDMQPMLAQRAAEDEEEEPVPEA